MRAKTDPFNQDFWQSRKFIGKLEILFPFKISNLNSTLVFRDGLGSFP